MKTQSTHRFSFGPWNISEGQDPFGPETRPAFPPSEKYALFKKLGFDGVQFHDDDVIPELESKAASQIEKEAAEMKRMLDGEGLVPEFVAPRLWFAPETVDGGLTSNSAANRQYAKDRCRKTVDIANMIGSKAFVFWFAREGSYVREAKDAKLAYERILGGINDVLSYDKEIEIWIEPKPNEPTDQAYVPTIGHTVALAYASDAPERVKGLIETAHAQLAGLDASDEMAFALAHNKLASVHLNDQNGLKYDQDKNFASANLRAGFNQIRVLEDAGYGANGEFIGLDVKAMRTQGGSPVTAHLENSRKIFCLLLEKVRSWDREKEAGFREACDYEGLELAVMEHLMGV
ncbi:TIM barrel protein [Arenicella sp.]|nr:TIM barrel protein [Arenicella sp.]